MQTVDVLQRKETVLGFPVPIDHGKEEPGVFRMLRIQNAVGREMKNRILRQIRAFQAFTAGVKTRRDQRCRSGDVTQIRQLALRIKKRLDG